MKSATYVNIIKGKNDLMTDMESTMLAFLTLGSQH